MMQDSSLLNTRDDKALEYGRIDSFSPGGPMFGSDDTHRRSDAVLHVGTIGLGKTIGGLHGELFAIFEPFNRAHVGLQTSTTQSWCS